jgi:hypothetical protein
MTFPPLSMETKVIRFVARFVIVMAVLPDHVTSVTVGDPGVV